MTKTLKFIEKAQKIHANLNVLEEKNKGDYLSLLYYYSVIF